MPFGRVFAITYFLATAGVAAWQLARSTRPVDGCVALIAAGAAWSLIRGSRAARAVGLVSAVGLAAFAVWRFPDGGAWTLLVAFAALPTLGLLIVTRPLVGEPRRAGAGPWIATAGLVGLGLMAAWPAASPASLTAAAQAMPAAKPDRLVWTDFGTGLERARAEGKPLLVYFFAGWCGYCKKMDRETWSHPSVIERSEDVIAVKVNVDATHTLNGFVGSDLASRYRVSGTPSQLLLDAGGSVLARAGGYQTPPQLLGWLDGGLAGGGRAARQVTTP